MKVVPRLCICVLLLVLLLSAVPFVRAVSKYMYMIPNGQRVRRNGQPWPAVGHDVPYNPTGVLNVFGEAFEEAGMRWTAALCAADSDGDGESNGVELGDPRCTWKQTLSTEEKIAFQSASTVVSHPGYADSTTATERAFMDEHKEL